MEELKKSTYLLYHGRAKRAVLFRYALLCFDIVTISFFVASSMVPLTPIVLVIDFCIAGVLIVDFIVRLWIAESRRGFLFQFMTLADLIVIATLLVPLLLENFAFLRVVRTLRLIRSYHVLKDLRERYKFFARNEQVLQSVLNLFVFIFVFTALVYVFQVNVNPGIQTYTDALYFTVATLTTTGFGDITPEGHLGKILAIIIMIFGVALFLRLVQTIFRPQKAHVRCGTCGLNRHELDAVHCKHCGDVINIETEGA
jgi:voltage-gated potassium channel